jgi:hypothetical protein
MTVSQVSLLWYRRQFRLLLQRSWRQISRDKAAAMARLMSNLSSAVIFGAIFFRMQVGGPTWPFYLPHYTFCTFPVHPNAVRHYKQMRKQS